MTEKQVTKYALERICRLAFEFKRKNYTLIVMDFDFLIENLSYYKKEYGVAVNDSIIEFMELGQRIYEESATKSVQRAIFRVHWDSKFPYTDEEFDRIHQKALDLLKSMEEA